MNAAPASREERSYFCATCENEQPDGRWEYTTTCQVEPEQDAAEAFADYAYSNQDMWEAGHEWPVWVWGPDGVRTKYLITVECEPRFYASRDTKESGRTIYWLDKYADETTPCDCSLEGWAKWLSEPDEDWGRPEAAEDGDTFEASPAIRSDHVASVEGGSLSCTPPLPKSYGFLALLYGKGMGWDADDITETEGEMADLIADYEQGDSGWHVAALRHEPLVTLVYRMTDDGPVLAAQENGQ